MKQASPNDMMEMLRRYDTWVFDCDGTLWRGQALIEGVADALQLLRDLGKKVLFVTNNSTKSRKAFKVKFDQLQLPVDQAEIYSSSHSAAAYLQSIGFKKKAYVCGERGIMEELAAAGIAAVGGPDDNDRRLEGRPVEIDPEIGAVVCGADPGLSYFKVTYASLCLRHNPGCLFIATNTDSRGHFIEKQEWPGAGATVAAVQAVVGMEPIVTGKPSPFMLRDVCAAHATTPDRMIMVGDRLDTDIAWGHATGMATLLVLTGITGRDDLAAEWGRPGFQRPDYVMASFGDLMGISAAARAAA
ncbi:phosphoglycolate phosphatase [Raphidocelis subcapitata]|uniref:Phosphoglycolate phosphatase n=1 Tax=Raphidocelis subcapitata TaxID=307507 RepID=A0A2V0PJ31_9CHLO|nr:phosphoglycolate phosphatase [Raphidocelis subcapitata]|eukprot:GBF99032.1 phosphoglycolate phosphatase [Raphidocelis subcapitata]